MNPRVAAHLIAALAAVPAACRPADTDHDPEVVNVVATDFAFKAPDTIPAGWTTLRLVNRGAQTDFVVLDRLPDGRTLDDFVAEVALDLW